MKASSAPEPPAVVWVERDPKRFTPDVAPGLPGWEIQKRRKSHWNARRSDGGREYFLKWFFHGRWVHPGRKEWESAGLLERLGIPSVQAVGWGKHPQGSFIVLEGSPGFPLDRWRERGLDERMMIRCARSLAALVARLHGAGYCHKDLNVYHVLVCPEGLRLIDIGRMARFTRRRWIVKDLASLAASARRESVPRGAWRAFFNCYLRDSGRRGERRSLLRACLGKARRYQRHNEKQERLPSTAR